MLYNPQLDTFLRVADLGSFTKAARESYVTPNAVMKQINLLEQDIGVPLFTRTHQGLQLTDAGRSLYHDAKKIIRYTETAVSRARDSMIGEKHVLRVGAAALNPVDFLVGLWPEIRRSLPDVDLRIVVFENEPRHAVSFFQNLGSDIDIVAGIYGGGLQKQFGCRTLLLKQEPIQVAVPFSHPLAGKKRLTPEDMLHETLRIAETGWIEGVDALRADLTAHYPQITLKSFPFFDLREFNESENEGSLIISVAPWERLHPLMKLIPVDWPYTIPYGLMYADMPSEPVQRFLEQVKACT